MKALTIWQPWASLIVEGAKPYEFRCWKPSATLVGQRIAIHAGARKPRIAEMRAIAGRLHGKDHWSTGLLREKALPLLESWIDDPSRLWLSSVLGTGVLGEAKIGVAVVEEFGPVRIGDHAIGDKDGYETANWAWPLSEIERQTPPDPCRGWQGLWNWEPPDA